MLSLDSAKSIAASIVGSRLDYCNSVLLGTSEQNLNGLQSVQNSLARCVTNASWCDSATGLWRSLHWLPVRERTRIQYKTALITVKTRLTGNPTYLGDLISERQPARSLRSAGPALLNTPGVSLKFGSSSFSIPAPAVWNGLPTQCRTCLTVENFKTLKPTSFARRILTELTALSAIQIRRAIEALCQCRLID